MFSFYLWETVDIPIELTREDGTGGILTGYKNVIISFQQGGRLVEKDKDSPDVAIDSDNDTITVHMSQEDTSQFKIGNVDLQINILYENTERDTSCEAVILAERNLHRKVMA